jgi:hypothetical protein
MPRELMTIHQIMDRLIADIEKMTPDEKAHLRAKLLRVFGPAQERKLFKM